MSIYVYKAAVPAGAEYWGVLEGFAAQPRLRVFAGCRGIVAQLAEHAQYKLLAIALCQVNYRVYLV